MNAFLRISSLEKPVGLLVSFPSGNRSARDHPGDGLRPKAFSTWLVEGGREGEVCVTLPLYMCNLFLLLPSQRPKEALPGRSAAALQPQLYARPSQHPDQGAVRTLAEPADNSHPASHHVLENLNTPQLKWRHICDVPVMSKVCSQGHVSSRESFSSILPFTLGPWESHFRLGGHIYFLIHQEIFFIVRCSLMQHSAIVFGVYKQYIKTLQPGVKNMGPGLRSLRFIYWLHGFSPCVPLSKSLNLSVLRSLVK